MPADAQRLDAARSKLHERFGKRLELDEREAGRELVEELRGLAGRSRAGSPAHYVLLEEAVLAARRSHDAPLLLEVFDAQLEAVEADEEAGGPQGGAPGETCLALARRWRALARKESSAPLREGYYRRADRWYQAALERTADVFDRDVLAGERDEMRPDFGPDWRFLAELKEAEVRAPFGELGKDGWMGLERDEVRIGGTLCLHSLGLHAGNEGDDALLRYDLGGAWSSLRGAVALNDTSAATRTAPLVFHLRGDGKALWSSEPITSVEHTQDFSVRVRGVETLELVIECRGPNRSAHSIWVEPVLAR